MIDFAALAAWLDTVPTELSFKFVVGPREPEFGQGDQIAMVSALGGQGLTLEAAGDLPSFQVKLTARDHQVAELHRSAFQIDAALILGDYPENLWGTRIQYVTRSGGGPESLPEDELDRVSYVCTYTAHETPER